MSAKFFIFLISFPGLLKRVLSEAKFRGINTGGMGGGGGGGGGGADRSEIDLSQKRSECERLNVN